MTCKVITGASAATLETAINDWLDDMINVSNKDVTITHMSISEGTVGASAIKACIFYIDTATVKEPTEGRTS